MALKQKRAIPSELEGVAYAEDVNAIQEKVEKCYSTERYQDFQDAVKKIVLDTLGNEDGRAKVKSHATEATKEYLNQATWERAKFWVPTILAAASLVFAIFFKQ